MVYTDRKAGLVGKFLEFNVPQTTPASIAAASIGGDEQFVRLGIHCTSHLVPPATDRFNSKLGSIMIDSYTDPAKICVLIKDSIRGDFAKIFVDEIIDPDLLGASFRLILFSLVRKITNKLFFLASTEITG